MKIIDLCFTRGEGEPPVDRFVAVDVPDALFPEFKAGLEDSIASYMDSTFDAKSDTPYTTAVNDIMNACGWRWIPLGEDSACAIRI